MIRPEEWGKGYATEAAAGMLEFAFEELELPLVYAGCAPDNHASRRVMEKLGMRPLGPYPVFPGSPPWLDSLAFVIERDDWAAHRSLVAG